MPNTRGFLQRLGFTPSEAIVYDFLLKKGSATVINIYKNLGLNRVTVYEILKRFLKRGFVSKSKFAEKDLFTLEPPDRLREMINEKELEAKRFLNKLEELKTIFGENLYKIKQVYNAHEKDVDVQVYSSMDEMMRYRKNRQYLYSYIVFNKDIVEQWWPYDNRKKKRFDAYYKQYKPYPELAIYTGKKNVPPFILKHKPFTSLWVSQDKYPISADIGVKDGGEVIFVDEVTQEVKVIIIKNKHIAQTLITLINMAAETARRDALFVKESKAIPPKKVV